MSEKIIVITPTELHDFFEEIIKQINPPCEIAIHKYDNFRDIASVYSSLEDKADGFIVTGIVAKNIIEKNHKNHTKPILPVQIDLSSLYKMLLSLKIKNNDLDMNRIVLDYLLHIDTKIELIDIIQDPDPGSELRIDFDKWIDNASIEELYFLEELIVEKVVSLWNNKKIDLVINFYSSILSKLKDKGIPSIYAYPSTDTVNNAIKFMLYQIRSSQFNVKLPAVISISPKLVENNETSEWNMISLHKHLLDFKHNNIADYLIQREKREVSIITNVGSAQDIIDVEQSRLENFLRESLDFKVAIGYGIGNTINQAKNNSTNARQESITYGKSFLIDENDNLIGPLESANQLKVSNEITPYIQDIANKAQLSTLTIQKLISIIDLLEGKEITSRDIASYMGVTIRNANRILSNLEKNDLVVLSHEKSTSTRGRPLKVYRILF